MRLKTHNVLAADITSALHRGPRLTLTIGHKRHPSVLRFRRALTTLIYRNVRLGVRGLRTKHGSGRLSLSRPCVSPSHTGGITLPEGLPAFSSVTVPGKLATVGATSSFSDRGRGGSSGSPRDHSFPYLTRSRVIHCSPGRSVRLAVQCSPGRFPCLRRETLSTKEASTCSGRLHKLVLPTPRLLLRVVTRATQGLSPRGVIASMRGLCYSDLGSVQDRSAVHMGTHVLPERNDPSRPMRIVVASGSGTCSRMARGLTSTIVGLGGTCSRPPRLAPLTLGAPVHMS